MAPAMARPSPCIGNAGAHQEAADIGEAEAQGAVIVGKLGDFAGGELGHQHRNLQHDGPEPDGMFEGVDVKQLDAVRLAEAAIRFSEARLQAVSSRNMYSLQGLRRRISPPAGQVCQSLMLVWNWMPGSADRPRRHRRSSATVRAP